MIELLAPLGLLGVGALAGYVWGAAGRADAGNLLFRRGYDAGWRAAERAWRAALGQETTGQYRLADVLRQANRRMGDE